MCLFFIHFVCQVEKLEKTTALTVVVFQTFHHIFFWMMFHTQNLGNVFKMDLFFMMPHNHQPGTYYEFLARELTSYPKIKIRFIFVYPSRKGE